jgi:hypothetical protein
MQLTAAAAVVHFLYAFVCTKILFTAMADPLYD